jgi:hypothetical protein
MLGRRFIDGRERIEQAVIRMLGAARLQRRRKVRERARVE